MINALIICVIIFGYSLSLWLVVRSLEIMDALTSPPNPFRKD